MESSTGKRVVPFPHEVFQHIFQFLGPLDLNASRAVSRAWREAANQRAKSLETYSMYSIEDLQDGLDILSTGPRRPLFIIQELHLNINDDKYHESPQFNEFINVMSGLSFGKIVIENTFKCQFQPGQVQEILAQNPNLFHLEFQLRLSSLNDGFQALENTFDYSSLFQRQEIPAGRVGETYFPALQNVIMPNSVCSLTGILRACPNLKYLALDRLTAPFYEDIDGSKLKRLQFTYLDVATCQQLLRILNLSLTHFVGIFATHRQGELSVNDFNQMRRLIRLFRQFLETQAPTLEKLSVTHDGNEELKNHSDLLPCPLSHLIEFTITIEFISDFNDILASFPKLICLCLRSDNDDLGIDDDPLISRCIPARIINEHSGIKELRVWFPTLPHELALYGAAFQNLTKLVLNRVSHGLLPTTVYLELTRLTVLHIIERTYFGTGGAHYKELHDTDFTGTHYPRTPYIGRMTNLQEIKITFCWKTKEVVDSEGDEESDDSDEGSAEDAPASLITDLMLTNGIFDIVKQLRKLVIERAEFSPKVLKKLGSFMKPHAKNLKTSDYHHFDKHDEK